MNDRILERIALLSVIAGLILILFVMPSYEAVDAHFLFEDDNNAFLEGVINRKSYNDDSGWSFLEINSCRTFKSFYEGEILKEEDETILVKGSFFDGSFSIEEYE